MTAKDGEKDCGALKASSTSRKARTSSLGFVSSFGVHQLVTDLYNQRVSLSMPAKGIMLSVAARKIDQKYTALADLCGNSRFESAATNPVDATGFVESDAAGSGA